MLLLTGKASSYAFLRKTEYERPSPAQPDPARPMPTLLRCLYLRDRASDFHTVFTGAEIHSSYLDHSRTLLIWGGGTLAGSTCRVKGVKMAARLWFKNGSADCDQIWYVVSRLVYQSTRLSSLTWINSFFRKIDWIDSFPFSSELIGGWVNSFS